WTLDLCASGAQPAACDPVPFEGGDGAFDVGAWDTTCETARAVAGEAKRVRFDPGPHRRGLQTYSLRPRGFPCTASSSDAHPRRAIGWSGLRGTAVVRFSAVVTRGYGCLTEVVAGVAKARSSCWELRRDAAVSTDPVRVNGVDLSPVDGARIAIDVRRKLLTT